MNQTQVTVHSTTDIVRRVLEGDTDAFEVLVEQHQNKLVGVLMRILRDRVAAEEVAQDTFVKAYTRLADYRAEASFSTWLIQIGVNLTRDRQRRQTRLDNRGIVSLDALRSQDRGYWEPADERPAADPQSELEDREKWACFERALGEIPTGFREVFTLRHLENFSYDEIATVTGDSPGTVRVRTHRARSLIKQKMEAMGITLGATNPARDPFPRRRQEGT